jgi:hypothetical protein
MQDILDAWLEVTERDIYAPNINNILWN